MQFLTSLFGGSENTIVTAALALGVVLVLIVLGLWVLKVVFRATNNIGRGAARRLSVVDVVAVDTRRQLMIIRRDNVEHLILTGGPQDVVVESNIPVERPSPPLRRPKPAVPAPAAHPSESSPVPDPVPSHPAANEARAASQNLVTLSTMRSPMDRLRDVAKASEPVKPSSLRHTGLMRPVSRFEKAILPINPEKPSRVEVDSATSSSVGDGHTRLAETRYLRDGYQADGN